jgi:excinuclease ABC subunit A
MEFFDPQRVVAFPELSLAGGAIKGWDRRNPYYFSLIESLARHYKFSVDGPFQELPPHIRKSLLHGSGEEEIRFNYALESGPSDGRKVSKKHPWEGIIPSMERRYRETDSAAVREPARYRSLQPRPACEGTRLRSEARHVRLGQRGQARAIFEVGHTAARQPAVVR